MGDDRPPRYEEGDKIIYRASSLGACTRSIVAAANNLERKSHPEWFQAILDEGTGAEAEISAMWDAVTDVPTIASQAVVEMVCGEMDGKTVVVRGSIDGMSSARDGVLREYKKFRVTTWPDFVRQGVEVHANYPWQVSAYMHGGAFDECEFVGGEYMPAVLDEKTGAVVVAAYIAQVRVSRLLTPPIPRKAIVKRVLMLEAMIQSGVTPNDLDCDRSMYPCPYFYLPGHSKSEDKEHATLVLTDDAEIYTQVALYLETSKELTELNKHVKLLDARKKAAKDVVIAAIKDAGLSAGGVVTLGDSGYTAEWTETDVKAEKKPRAGFTKTALTIKKEST